MKIFKTVLWTSLFWILVIVGLWVASLFFPQEATIIIPEKVKSVIIQNSGIEIAVTNGEEEPVKIEEEIAPVEEEPIVEESVIEENQAPEEEIEEVAPETTNSSIIPQPAQATDEIAELKSRVNELEIEYQTLVEELQTIFSTPVFSQLLSQAFSQQGAPEEASNE